RRPARTTAGCWPCCATWTAELLMAERRNGAYSDCHGWSAVAGASNRYRGAGAGRGRPGRASRRRAAVDRRVRRARAAGLRRPHPARPGAAVPRPARAACGAGPPAAAGPATVADRARGRRRHRLGGVLAGAAVLHLPAVLDLLRQPPLRRSALRRPPHL